MAYRWKTRYTGLTPALRRRSIERVRRLLTHTIPSAAEAVKTKQLTFNLSVWGTKSECGTTHCLLGHAGTQTWFRRRGLKLWYSKLDKKNPNNGRTSGRLSVYEWELAQFFGVYGCDLDQIIYPNSYALSPTVRDVEKRLKSFVKHLERTHAKA